MARRGPPFQATPEEGGGDAEEGDGDGEDLAKVGQLPGVGPRFREGEEWVIGKLKTENA